MGCMKLTYQTNLKPVYRVREKEVAREEKESRQNLWETVDTGNHYYGARYYNSNLSIWLSVDPLADKYPSYSPYNFVLNNPVSYQDPNGMWVEDGDGNWIAQEGDGAETLAKDAGISLEEAYSVMDEQGYGTYTDDDGVTKSAVYPGDVVSLGSGGSSGGESTSCGQSCSGPAATSSTPTAQGSQNPSNLDGLDAAFSIMGYTRLGQESLLGLLESGEVATASKFLKFTGGAISLANAGVNIAQYNEASRNNDALGQKQAAFKATTNSLMPFFPIGTAAGLGGQLSLELNPDMSDPAPIKWTPNTVCFVAGTQIMTDNEKATKTKGAFTSETAIIKQIYLATINTQTRWNGTMFGWSNVRRDLCDYFEDRFLTNDTL